MFLATALVVVLPAVPLTLLVRGLLDRSVSDPFLAEIELALDGTVTESRERLQEEKRHLADDLRAAGWPATAGPALPGVTTFELPGTVPPGMEEVAASAREIAGDAGTGAADVQRMGDLLVIAVADTARAGVLHVATRPLPRAMAAHAERAAETLGLVRALRGDRDAAVESYVWPFVVTYLALLAAATVLGAYLARRIARPVEAEIARLARVAAWRDFARGLAHEIKNPLTPIQLAVQQLSDRLPKDVDPSYAALSRECTEIVNEEVAALRTLVREFSEFARLPEPKVADGDLAALLDDIGRLYGERVVVESPRPLPAAFDAPELRRAVVNLVDNGLAACASASVPERVVLRARSDADGVLLDIADAGCGIDPANLSRVFEPSFSTKPGSMGLGLAIVDGIVRGHDGTIEVRSQPGRGTTFTMRLPARRAPHRRIRPPAKGNA
jgi:nitrogen fixation/metabolism regulation signal transduction histidine kinase